MRHTFLLALAALAAAAPAAKAEDLLFASLEAKPDGDAYAGGGWMSLPQDGSGVVLSFEMGSSADGGARLAALAGWRVAMGRTVATFLGGAEAAADEPMISPLASVDLWWDQAGWMATARAQMAADYTSWRAAFGRRIGEGEPFVGPELSSTGDAPRLGMHATGLDMPGGFEARASAGTSLEGDYAELSLWRRF